MNDPIPLGIRMLKDVPEFRKISRKASKALIWGRLIGVDSKSSLSAI